MNHNIQTFGTLSQLIGILCFVRGNIFNTAPIIVPDVFNNCSFVKHREMQIDVSLPPQMKTLIKNGSNINFKLISHMLDNTDSKCRVHAEKYINNKTNLCSYNISDNILHCPVRRELPHFPFKNPCKFKVEIVATHSAIKETVYVIPNFLMHRCNVIRCKNSEPWIKPITLESSADGIDVDFKLSDKSPEYNVTHWVTSGSNSNTQYCYTDTKSASSCYLNCKCSLKNMVPCNKYTICVNSMLCPNWLNKGTVVQECKDITFKPESLKSLQSATCNYDTKSSMVHIKFKDAADKQREKRKGNIFKRSLFYNYTIANRFGEIMEGHSNESRKLSIHVDEDKVDLLRVEVQKCLPCLCSTPVSESCTIIRNGKEEEPSKTMMIIIALICSLLFIIIITILILRNKERLTCIIKNNDDDNSPIDPRNDPYYTEMPYVANKYHPWGGDENLNRQSSTDVDARTGFALAPNGYMVAGNGYVPAPHRENVELINMGNTASTDNIASPEEATGRYYNSEAAAQNLGEEVAFVR